MAYGYHALFLHCKHMQLKTDDLISLYLIDLIPYSHIIHYYCMPKKVKNKYFSLNNL